MQPLTVTHRVVGWETPPPPWLAVSPVLESDGCRSRNMSAVNDISLAGGVNILQCTWTCIMYVSKQTQILEYKSKATEHNYQNRFFLRIYAHVYTSALDDGKVLSHEATYQNSSADWGQTTHQLTSVLCILFIRLRWFALLCVCIGGLNSATWAASVTQWYIEHQA